MRTSNIRQTFSSGDPVWVLLVELSSRDFLPDPDRRDEPTAGVLLQKLRELDMSPECMENIARMLAGFAREACLRTQQESLEFPGRIRIFCQKKMINYANAQRAASRPYHAEQVMEHSLMIPDFDAKMIGGWGCFLIERGSDASDASPSSNYLVDLYLYREG